MAGVLYACTWGDVVLFVSRLEWDPGNTIVKHDPASGPFHPTQMRGPRIRTATAEIIFDDIPEAGMSGVDAYRRFAATSTERRLFTHPVDGAFYCQIDGLKVTQDSDCITATVEFVPDEVPVVVTPTGAGSSPVSGAESVSQAADRVTTELVAVGAGIPDSKASKMDFTKPISRNIALAYGVKIDASFDFSASAGVSADVALSASASASASADASVTASARASAFAFANVYASAYAEAKAKALAQASGTASASAFAFAYASAAVMADARATTDAWAQAEDLSSRQVQIDVARISDSIVSMIEVGQLESDIALFPAYRAVIMLGEALRLSAISATSETPRVFVVKIKAPVSLLAICAKIYGGADAQDRARQVAALNDIKTVGWLDAGSYLMPEASRKTAPVIA